MRLRYKLAAIRFKVANLKTILFSENKFFKCLKDYNRKLSTKKWQTIQNGTNLEANWKCHWRNYVKRLYNNTEYRQIQNFPNIFWKC